MVRFWGGFLFAVSVLAIQDTKAKKNSLHALSPCSKNRDLKALISADHRSDGAIAQLVERLNGIQEVSGSIPLSSTTYYFLTFKLNGQVPRCV